MGACLVCTVLSLGAGVSCGSDDGADGPVATTTSRPPATTSSGGSSTSSKSPSASTSTTSPSGDPGDPPPCNADAGAYSTAPDWQLDPLPEGFALDDSIGPGTYVEHREGSTLSSYTEFLLVEVDGGGRVLSDLRVQRWADLDKFEPDPAPSAGFAVAERGADSVRGHDGQIVRVINRGDLVGRAVARWVEGGAGWSASSSTLDLGALADVLTGLDLGDEVTDPQGGFVVLGRSGFADEARRTRIVLAGSGSTAGTRLVFDISAPAPGDVGMTDLHPGDSIRSVAALTVTQVGGRTVITDPTATSTTLPDGAVVSLEVRVPAGSPPVLDASGRLALIDRLERVDPDSWWSEDRSRSEELCRE